ncbi:amine oxidase like [Lecanosticta acicola]|uniref:Amine oxidase like n=1 Tax=Lecanosticta acicola TaxID=111012 RepID=A0AAI8Z935_9PEZI|nr:amine oxidase like [Lecanosticta acicola]
MRLFKRSPAKGSPSSSPANSAKKRMHDRKKVAIVGSGCAGLGAAWALQNSDYEVHILEKSDRLGGHTNTQYWHHGDQTVPVDTGFIVMNSATYPNFIRFLKEVDVQPVNTEMTFGVSRDRGALEWSGEARGIFAQKRNLFRPRHWRMIFDIVRFNQFALDILTIDEEEEEEVEAGENYLDGSSPPLKPSRKREADMTIGEYLDRHGYSQGFRDDYLIPMTAAVWSTSPDKASLEFPAKTLIRFMWNHHLLSTVAERPAWLTIAGGSQRYIDAIVDQFPEDRLHVHTSCEVANVLRPSREGDGLVTVSWINAKSGKIEGDAFDHVILACHGDEVLPLLAKHGARQRPTSSSSSMTTSTNSASSSSPRSDKFVKSSSGVQYVSQEELDILSAFQTTENVAWLHSDLDLMPKRREVWTAWNYLVSSTPSQLSHPAGVSLTYCMNILQHLSEDMLGPVLVTLNPDREPDPRLTQGKFVYRHPLYTVEAVRAQKRLDKIQNTRGVSYCGAWTKYGFHEDGFSSGLRVATEHLGAKLPFEFVDSTYSRGNRPHFTWQDNLLRIVLSLMMVWIRVVGLVVNLPVIAPLISMAGGVATMLLDVAEHFGIL